MSRGNIVITHFIRVTIPNRRLPTHPHPERSLSCSGLTQTPGRPPQTQSQCPLRVQRHPNADKSPAARASPSTRADSPGHQAVGGAISAQAPPFGPRSPLELQASGSRTSYWRRRRLSPRKPESHTAPANQTDAGWTAITASAPASARHRMTHLGQ